MKRNLPGLALIALLAATGLAAQDGRQGGGAAPQGNRINWNANTPWGPREGAIMGLPMDQQKTAPFKVFDNVYYVGLRSVGAYLVTTSEGLVLIDAGYAVTSDIILDNIREAGFNPANVRYIFLTHQHADHWGGAAKVKQVSGARVGLSQLDWQGIEEQQKPGQRGQRGAENNALILARDLVISDGQTINVGDTPFKFYVTPGHTPGAVSIELRVRDGEKSYRALVPGGIGLANQPPALTKPMIETLQRFKQLGPWDVMLPNHPFLSPTDILADVKPALASRKPGDPHPAVYGADALNRHFDAVAKVANEKLAFEQKGSK
jgi:metallo-beta-lactamase class B